MSGKPVIVHDEALAVIRALVAQCFPWVPLGEIAVLKPAPGYDMATNAAFVIVKHTTTRAVAEFIASRLVVTP